MIIMGSNHRKKRSYVNDDISSRKHNCIENVAVTDQTRLYLRATKYSYGNTNKTTMTADYDDGYKEYSGIYLR